MGFFKRLLLCGCPSRKKSRKARKEHARLNEMSETFSSDQNMGSTQSCNSQDWLITSDEMSSVQPQDDAYSELEMPSAQTEDDANSDLEMPTAQIQNDANSDLEMPTAQIQNDANPDLEMPTAQIQNDANSDLELPTAQTQNDANSDLELPTAQTQSDATETVSWNQHHHFEENAAKMQLDLLMQLQDNIQDVMKITADTLQQVLRGVYFKVERELDETDRKMQRSPSGRLETILLINLHREHENILRHLAELVSRVQDDVNQASAKIQSDLDNVAASVQHDSKVPTDEYQQDQTGATDHMLKNPQEMVAELQFSQTEVTLSSAQTQDDANSDLGMLSAQIQNDANFDLEMLSAQIQNDANSDLGMPSAQMQNDANSDLEMPSAQIQNDANSDLAMPTAQIQNDANSDLEMPTAQIQNDANSDLVMPSAQIQNDANSDLEMPSAQVQNDANSDLAMPTAQIQNDANSDLEMPSAQVQNDANSDLAMPTAQIQNDANSDLEMPTAQTQNDATETISWNQHHHLEETAAKMQLDLLMQLQDDIQDVMKITADTLQQVLRGVYFKVERELDETDRKMQRGPSGRLETILLINLHREHVNILRHLAELVSRVQDHVEQTAAKIQSDLDMVAASVQHDSKVPTGEYQLDRTGATDHILKDCQEMVAELQFSQAEVTLLHLDKEDGQKQLQLKTIGGNSEFRRDEKTENVEQKVPECGSEQEEQAAEGEIEMKIETPAAPGEEQEENGPCISEESFVFHRVLGRGGFGKVMLAELKASGQYYAVKTIAKAPFLVNEAVDYLRTERRVLMLATESPFLSHLHCIFQTEDYLFLVMEYIRGGNLNFHLQQQVYFDLPIVRFFAAEMICGLQFLHSNGVIYRDLKPQNVMLDQDGHIKIVDFGISKENMFGDRRTKTFCGSPYYMAPEMHQRREYGTPVDWWAFGVLLFQLLVGKVPFTGNDLDELSESVCSGTPKYPFRISYCTRDLLGQLLEKDPDSRLGTSGDIRAHPFFKPIDWAKIERREVKPPYKPKLKSPLDCSYFEEEFLDETPGFSRGGSGCSLINQSDFVGFSFMNPKFAALTEHE